MRTVSQLNTLLSSYLYTRADGQSVGTTTLGMLNAVLPVLYAMGDWKALLHTYEVDVSAGYFCLPPDDESVVGATLKGYPMEIRTQNYEFQQQGPGKITRPVSYAYGLIDQGMQTLMSDISSDGCDELIFTCATATFASGDIATITYTDTDEGYAQIALPLNAMSVTISSIADGGTDDDTGEELTELTVTTTTGLGLVAGLGLTITPADPVGDISFVGTFRIHSVPSSTTIMIVKSWAFETMSGTAVGAARLMPVSTIASVESIVYTSLPGRTVVKDADGIIYGILPAGDGVASFRRYACPQIPTTATEADEWDLVALVKRAFIPLTGNSDLVYLDNIPALTAAFLAVVARDGGDYDREAKMWEKARAILDKELFDTRGGADYLPSIELWGEGIPGMCNL